MDLADLMGPAGVVEDAFSGRRFTRINVGHDADITITLDRLGTCHDPLVLEATQDLGLPA